MLYRYGLDHVLYAQGTYHRERDREKEEEEEKLCLKSSADGKKVVSSGDMSKGRRQAGNRMYVRSKD